MGISRASNWLTQQCRTEQFTHKHRRLMLTSAVGAYLGYGQKKLSNYSQRGQIVFWVAWWIGSYSLARFQFDQSQSQSLSGATIFTFLVWVCQGMSDLDK